MVWCRIGPGGLAARPYWFQANYSGDANNLVPAGGLKSACTSEPLTVVKANISIAPNDTNLVGFPHTFTVTVKADSGNGQGFQPAADANVTVTLTPTNGANPTPAGPFTGTTDANGQFKVTFTSFVGGAGDW